MGETHNPMHHPSSSPHAEPHALYSSSRQNWLRAAILGANDGIVSLAALIVGVASATTTDSAILLVGIAGILAGALSMAVGEYVSVSSQRDTERALIKKEQFELHSYPEEELQELIGLYEKKGLTRPTAETVAHELTAHDAFAAHAEVELGINPNHLTSPWQAAAASALSFTAGALIPLIAVLLPLAPYRIAVTFGAVLVALIITGVISAQIGGANKIQATLRVVIGGAIAMAITSGVGKLFGVSGI